jgi:hypothetical protein
MAEELAKVTTLNGSSFSILDDKLLYAAEQGWTPNQMQKKYGIPAQDAAVRVKMLLDSHDVWTVIERKKLIINSMMRVKQVFDNRLNEIVDTKGMATNYIKLLGLISDRLDKETQFTEDEISKVSEVQKRHIITAVETGYYNVRQYLKDYHPEVDLAEVDAEFRVGLQEGFIESE